MQKGFLSPRSARGKARETPGARDPKEDAQSHPPTRDGQRGAPPPEGAPVEPESASDTMLCLHLLPPEILTRILAQLAPEEKACLAWTCRAFRRVLKLRATGAGAKFSLEWCRQHKPTMKWALDFIRAASKEGHAGAQCMLGICARDGLGGLKPMEPVAMRYFEQAAHKGHAEAQAILGECYARGTCGVEAHSGTALKWARRSAKQGSANGAYVLGRKLLDVSDIAVGEVSKPHVVDRFAEAAKWIGAAAAQGHADAMFWLALAHKNNWVRARRESDSEASLWLHKAAERGHAPAHFQLGELCRTSLAPDMAAAVHHYTRAVELGQLPEAMVALAWHYRFGKGVDHDNKLAVHWYTQAAKGGHEYAQYLLGRLHREGLCGLAQDEEKGDRWLKKAAKQGYDPACEATGMHFRDNHGNIMNAEEASLRAQFSADPNYFVRKTTCSLAQPGRGIRVSFGDLVSSFVRDAATFG